MKIEFIQYLRPDGRKTLAYTEIPDKHQDRVTAIRKAGYRFEMELLKTNDVSLTISDDEDDWVCIVVPNGPLVLPAIEELIETFPVHYLNPKGA